MTDFTVAHERISLDLSTLFDLSVHERIVDRLTDLLLDAEDILQMLRSEDATSVRWIAPQMQAASASIDMIISELAD